MSPSIRAGALPAALFLLVAFDAAALEIRVDPDPGWRSVADFGELVAELDGWLDRHAPWPANPAPPAVRVVAAAEAAARRGGAGRMGLVTRGLYDPDTATVYLVAPWSMRRAADVSVLLHELVHHRQQGARHWVCPGAQEPAAYDLQAVWLAERGIGMKVNRIAVVLAAGCNNTADKHPD